MIHDGYNWVIKEISKQLADNINKHNYAKATTSESYNFIFKKILHFNSVTIPRKFNTNKTIMTWYHVVKNDPRLTQLEEISSRIDKLHTSANITKNTLINHGFPEDKIVVLPMGIDLKMFTQSTQKDKTRQREFLNIPQNKFVIGSFQKDGNGWEKGMEPKLIKGPDIFCDTVEQVAKNYPVHILLSGPARGYVKARLEQAKISFTHTLVANYSDMNLLYQACDAYLISSRNEGIPMALLETWATGTPLVSTRVGMVADVAINGHNALIADINDSDTLVASLIKLIEDETLKNQLISNSQITIQQFSWDVLTEKYWKELYSPLLHLL